MTNPVESCASCAVVQTQKGHDPFKKQPFDDSEQSFGRSDTAGFRSAPGNDSICGEGWGGAYSPGRGLNPLITTSRPSPISPSTSIR